jgi:hypothetical protein
MAASARIGRNAPVMKIVKYGITIGAVVITSLGSMALNDEQAREHSHEVVSMSVSEQVIDGVRDTLSPFVSWLAEPEEHAATCSPQASANR